MQTKTKLLMGFLLLAVLGSVFYFSNGSLLTGKLPKINPDLKITKIIVSPQPAIYGGETSVSSDITVSVVVGSSNTTPRATTVSYTLEGTPIPSSTVTTFKRAGMQTVTTTFNPTRSGSQTLTACVDQANLIPETNDKNNCMSTTFAVEEALPDLIIRNSFIEPEYPNLIVDTMIRFSASAYNQGTLASEDFDAVLFIDINNDNTRDVTEMIPVTSVDINEETDLEYQWTAPSTDERFQAHSFYFCVDPYNLIPESNEDNNCSTLYRFTTEMNPDLAIDNVRYTPNEPLVGQVIVFTATVSNIGIGPSDYGLDTTLVIDTNNDYTLEDAESWEIIVQDAMDWGLPNPGESQEFSLQWTPIMEQEYRYMICVGEGKSEGEINRANNCSEIGTFEVITEEG